MATAGTESGWDRRKQARLHDYEQVALQLFAERGFRDVTVDHIAEAAGVSVRTLFRYFPTKDDCLLVLPRRNLDAKLGMIEALDPGPSPVDAAWAGLMDLSDDRAGPRGQLTLWRRAARDAPDVVARVRGERIELLIRALTDYFERALQADTRSDVRPRLLAGILAGGEMAVAESITRSRLPRAALLAEAKACMIRVGRPIAEAR